MQGGEVGEPDQDVNCSVQGEIQALDSRVEAGGVVGSAPMRELF